MHQSINISCQLGHRNKLCKTWQTNGWQMHRHCSTHCEGMPVTNIQHTHPFNSPLSGTTRVSRYQKGKTNLDFAEARDSEWQWNPLGHMQVCTSLQTDNHASTPPLSFLQAGCPSCRPTNSVKALKAITKKKTLQQNAVHDQQSVSHWWHKYVSQKVKTGLQQFDICWY